MFKNTYSNNPWMREQHKAIRTTAGWYYFTHCLIEVTGEDAARFLDTIFAMPIASLKVGRARYTVMLNDDGMIIDDDVIFRIDEGTYWVSTLYAQRMIPWFDAHREGFAVEYRILTNNLKHTIDMDSVQGPKSLELVNAVLDNPVDDLRFFDIRDNSFNGTPVKVARAGFTGEKFGYEIYYPTELRGELEAKLEEAGAPLGAMRVTDVQVMVWTIPVEKGYTLMTDLAFMNPIEAGMDARIGWDKDFIGKDALLKVKEEGPEKVLLGFITDDEDIHIVSRNVAGQCHPVIKDGEVVGDVTMLAYSYTLEKNVGYALVDRSKATVGDKVTMHGYGAVLTEPVFV